MVNEYGQRAFFRIIDDGKKISPFYIACYEGSAMIFNFHKFSETFFVCFSRKVHYIVLSGSKKVHTKKKKKNRYC